MKTQLLLTAAAAALTPMAVRAATIAELDTVVVTASRTAERIDQVGGQIGVLDRAAIHAAQAPIVSDLLVRMPGVSLSRNGGMGSATQVRIRGAESDQSVVLIDGVKLNDPATPGGGYNFAHLVSGDVARIEVLRGAQSVAWGSQAIGGVVNVITAAPTAPFEGRLEAEGGSFGTTYLRASAGGKSDRLTWQANAGHLSTGGISAFDRRQGGRERDGYRNTTAALNAEVAASQAVSLDLRGRYIRGRTAFDGFPPPAFNFADTAEYGVVQQWIGYAGLNLTQFDGKLRHRIAYARTRIESDNFDTAFAPASRTFDSTGSNRRIEYQGVWTFTKGWTAVYGAESERSSMRAAFTPDRTTRMNGLYGLAKGEIAPGLVLGAGLRMDNHRDFGNHWVGQAQAAWTLNDGATLLRASFGQGFKAPTLYQLGSEFGNAALKPEAADSWDIGAEQRLAEGRIVLSTAYFHRTSTNLIDFVSCFGAAAVANPLCRGPSGAPRFGYYDNVARAAARGVELEGRAKVTDAISLNANYAWTRSRNTSPGSANRGRDLARRPEHQGYAEAAWGTSGGATVAVGVRFVGKAFDDAANRNELKSYAVADVRVSWPFSDRMELYGRIENLTDAKYQVIRNYGTPGRSAYAGARAKF